MNEKLQTVQDLERQFGTRFHYLSGSWTKKDVQNFRTASPRNVDSLNPFWNSTRKLGKLAMQRALNTPVSISDANVPALIVCIPRGAYPAAQGAFEQNNVPMIVTNDGGNRNSNLPLIPGETPAMKIGTLIM